MKGTVCRVCGTPVRLTKTGALRQHKLPAPRMVISIELTAEKRKQLEEEVRRWMADPQHIMISPQPVVTYLGTPACCPASGRYPKLVTA